jgi:hypothetical protein
MGATHVTGAVDSTLWKEQRQERIAEHHRYE